MKFFNYLTAFLIVLIRHAVSIRWGILWFFQLVFIAIGFGDLIKIENVHAFNSILVIWSTIIVICLNVESSFSDLKTDLIRKIMPLSFAKSSESSETSHPEQ